MNESFSKGLGLDRSPVLDVTLDVARFIPLSMASASADAISEASIRRRRIALLGDSVGSSLASSQS
jgi:hypothetical protein